MNIFDEFEEKKRLLELQKEYEEGIIIEEELSEKQKEELIGFYNNQIKYLEEEITRSKVTFNMLKNTISKKINKLKKIN